MELTRPDGTPLRVLVVDDEVNIAELISMALRYEGWEIATAGDGVLDATKFPREGAGMLSSLVDTDGLVELGEELTEVRPGQTIPITVVRDGHARVVRVKLGERPPDTRPTG